MGRNCCWAVLELWDADDGKTDVELWFCPEKPAKHISGFWDHPNENYEIIPRAEFLRVFGFLPKLGHIVMVRINTEVIYDEQV